VRILKVTQSYHPFLERGGPAVKVRALALGLAARGHQVTVVTADLSRGQPRELGEKTRWGRRSLEQGVETIYLPTAYTFRALTVNPALFRFCRERLGEFDVAHIYGLYDVIGPTVAWQCRRRRIPYFVEPMGMYRPIDRAFFLKGLWRVIFGKRMIGNAWRMIATSELEGSDLREGGISAERVLLRYNPVDVADYQTLPPRGGFRQKWNISAGEPVILFLSRLIPRKGADLLIEAFAEALPQEGTLVIAGPEGVAGYLERLRAVAERCGVSGRVQFTGGLYGEEKKAALADADIFALPSSYENFANVVAEAVASGVPVVVTPHCGIHSLVDQRAGLVVERSREALVGALRELMTQPELRERLRAGCRAVAEELSPEKTVARLESFYADRAG
jgi:glycosyltransferase involved in cell wall biosynthesis